MDYEYRCTWCRHVFTLTFPFAQNPPTATCPECLDVSERFFGTVPPICFKGSGWASKSELDAMDPKNDNPQDFTEFTGV